MTITFDTSLQIEPLWTVVRGDVAIAGEEGFEGTLSEGNKPLKDWLAQVFSQVSSFQRKVFNKDVLMGEFYQGFQHVKGQEGRVVRGKDFKSLKVSVNRTKSIIDLINSKVLTGSRKVVVSPANSDEFKDRQSAKMSEKFIEHLWYTKKIKRLFKKFARDSRIYGDGVIGVKWDRYAGDMYPTPANTPTTPSRQPGTLEPLVDETGAPRLNDQGMPILVDRVDRVGEVSLRVIKRRYLVLQPGKNDLDDIEWVIEIEVKDKTEILAKHPEIPQEESPEGFLSDIFTMSEERLGEHEQYVYCLYHKGTTFMDAGYYIEFTNSHILAESTLVEAVGHRELPFIWLQNEPDLETPYGVGVTEQLLLLQVLRNALTSLKFTNVAVGASAHWLVNKASRVDPAKLTNSFSVIDYAGSVKPEIVTYKTVTPDILTAIQATDDAMDKVSGIHSISYGETPKRMDSGAGIAELQEIEQRRFSPQVEDFDDAIEKVGRLCLATAGYFYRPDDGRTIRILGRANASLVERLDSSKLGGPYDIRVERGTSLGDTKAGRVALMTEMMQMDPTLFSKQEKMYLLDLGDLDKFYDSSKAAFEAQELENEMFLNGYAVAAPSITEDLEPRWVSMVRFAQNDFFKIDVPDEIKEMFIRNGRTREEFLVMKMLANPIFKERFLTEHQHFPIFLQPHEAIAALAGVLPGTTPPVEAQPTENFRNVEANV